MAILSAPRPPCTANIRAKRTEMPPRTARGVPLAPPGWPGYTNRLFFLHNAARTRGSLTT